MAFTYPFEKVRSVYLGFIFLITSAISSLTPWCLDSCCSEVWLHSVCFCLLCEDNSACLLHPLLLLRFLLPDAPSLQKVVHQLVNAAKDIAARQALIFK